MEEILKDHRVQLLTLHRIMPKSHTLCPRVFAQIWKFSLLTWPSINQEQLKAWIYFWSVYFHHVRSLFLIKKARLLWVSLDGQMKTGWKTYLKLCELETYLLLPSLLPLSLVLPNFSPGGKILKSSNYKLGKENKYFFLKWVKHS